MLRAQVLAYCTGDEASTGLMVVKKTIGKLSSGTGDAAYDTVAIDSLAGSRGAQVVVPPTRSASVTEGQPRSKERDKTVRRVRQVGRRRWKTESGYHPKGTVENALTR